jgi:hypothetical protein
METFGSVLSFYVQMVATFWDGGPIHFLFGMFWTHWPVFAILNAILDSDRPLSGDEEGGMNPGAQVDALRRAEEYREAERERWHA